MSGIVQSQTGTLYSIFGAPIAPEPVWANVRISHNQAGLSDLPPLQMIRERILARQAFSAILARPTVQTPARLPAALPQAQWDVKARSDVTSFMDRRSTKSIFLLSSGSR